MSVWACAYVCLYSGLGSCSRPGKGDACRALHCITKPAALSTQSAASGVVELLERTLCNALSGWGKKILWIGCLSWGGGGGARFHYHHPRFALCTDNRGRAGRGEGGRGVFICRGGGVAVTPRSSFRLILFVLKRGIWRKQKKREKRGWGGSLPWHVEGKMESSRLNCSLWC